MAAGLGVLVCSLPLVIGLPLASALVLGMSGQMWRLGLIGDRHKITAFRCSVEGEWQVCRAERWLPADLRPESRVWRRVVWLRWNTSEGRAWTLLIRAATPAAGWRQLQARLRLPNAVQHTSQANTASPTA